MSIVLLGMSHRTAPVELRERLAVAPEALPEVLASLHSEAGADEAVVLSTCNRVEVYACREDGDAEGFAGALEAFLAERAGLGCEKLPGLYTAFDGSAVKHLFTVASSLDSSVLGEKQILGQVRRAYSAAVSCGSTGRVLNRLFHQAIRLGRDVQSKTSVGRRHISISTLAVDCAKRRFPDLQSQRVLLVGAGEMAGLALDYLVEAGVHRITVANRNIAHARSLADRCGGEAVGLADMEGCLSDADILIASASSPGYLVDCELLEKTRGGRRRDALLILDIAVPRNVDPACAQLPGVELLCVDDLAKMADGNRRERMLAAEDAETMVDESFGEFSDWLSLNGTLPTIKALRFYADEVVAGELSKLKKRTPGLSGDELRSVEAAVNAVANKLLHRPFVALKDGDIRERLETARVLDGIYGLDSGAGRPAVPEQPAADAPAERERHAC